MKKYISHFLYLAIICSSTAQHKNQVSFSNLFPWCIVAFDAEERSPDERIPMLREMGFSKYAYDWRNKDLDGTEKEFAMAKANGIEIISVWLWLNAKRDRLGQLSSQNDSMLEIIKKSGLKTTLWLSFSPNFFEVSSQEESMETAIEMIEFVHVKAQNLGCDIALYNHRGWFGNPKNQIAIIKALPQYNLKMVYNFHHAHDYLDEFPQIAKEISPYLAAVNLNGMRKEGPKILPIGEGNLEKDMIKLLQKEGFHGPWGVLGHVEHEDVHQVLERNISGLATLGTH